MNGFEVVGRRARSFLSCPWLLGVLQTSGILSTPDMLLEGRHVDLVTGQDQVQQTLLVKKRAPPELGCLLAVLAPLVLALLVLVPQVPYVRLLPEEDSPRESATSRGRKMKTDEVRQVVQMVLLGRAGWAAGRGQNTWSCRGRRASRAAS